VRIATAGVEVNCRYKILPERAAPAIAQHTLESAWKSFVYPKLKVHPSFGIESQDVAIVLDRADMRELQAGLVADFV
jgi:hypothetical protein